KNATGSPRNEKHLNNVLHLDPPADLPMVTLLGAVLTNETNTFLAMVSSHRRRQCIACFPL
ncbi:hypothetical protein WH47_07953, partial [Habropoda laboriosa]